MSDSLTYCLNSHKSLPCCSSVRLWPDTETKLLTYDSSGVVGTPTTLTGTLSNSFTFDKGDT
jgi:hypothetical protein